MWASDARVECGVVCEEPDLGVDSISQVIDIDHEQGRPKDGTLGHSGDDWANTGALAFHDDLLGATTEEVGDPLVGLSSDPIVVQLDKEALVWDLIKGLGEVKQDHVCLASAVNFCCRIIHCQYKLCLAGPSFLEPC